MKKIFTLMIVLGAVIVANAQPPHTYPDGRYDSRDVVLGRNDNRPYDNNVRYGNAMNERERDRLIERINRDFDQQIRRVQYDRWLRPVEKDFQIRRLESQRRDAVRDVWDRYRNSNRRYDDHYPQNNRRW